MWLDYALANLFCRIVLQTANRGSLRYTADVSLESHLDSQSRLTDGANSLRSTLLFIPHEIAGIPLFGFGLVLGLLLLGFVGWLAWSYFQGAFRKEMREQTLGTLPVWGLAAIIVCFVLPAVEQAWPDGTPIGLPIRGYGVMVLTGLLAGIGISVHRGRQLGIESDTIIGLGFWMMLSGVFGARTFYVVQKWDEFQSGAIGERLISIVKLTDGGLVIYGGVIGGLVAAVAYCWRRQLSVLATADLVAPGFLIGLSIGRIGCLLHGCCFGGVCTANLPTIQFPHGSGPYQAQLATGRLLGIETEKAAIPGRIASVQPESIAAQAGLESGAGLRAIQILQQPPTEKIDPIQPIPLAAKVSVSSQEVFFPSGQLPKKSLPVHPSQIYSSLNALLLCLLVWTLQPLPSRDGIAFCIAIVLYAISRFLLEGVRSDEAGQLGTGLSVAQLVAISTVLAGGLGLFFIGRQPPGRSWRWPQTA